jgi:hypothetical protein
VSVLDPGLTRWRGMVLQSFVVAWLDLAKDEFKSGAIGKDQFKAMVARAVRDGNSPNSSKVLSNDSRYVSKNRV